MPREDRRITFENEEVYKAVFALCTQKQLKKPIPGHVVKITEAPGEAGAVTLHITNPHEMNSSSNEEYSRDFVAAALMLYCRGSGIPLPKTARKSVMIIDGVMILRVQI